LGEEKVGKKKPKTKQIKNRLKRVGFVFYLVCHYQRPRHFRHLEQVRQGAPQE
jgi:hypothetical protein